MKKGDSPYYSLENIERIIGIKREHLRKIAKRAGAYYQPYDTRQVKTNGEIKWRHIDNPKPELKYIQRKILRRILLKHFLRFPDGMVGGVSGKSIKDNAQPHTNKEMVVTLDIKDCFPRTTSSMIYNIWTSVLHCGKRQARLLTKLTTFRTILPQGAPTSNALCNFCLLPLFNKIKMYSDANDIAFTLYVDDVTLSGEAVKVLPAIRVVIRIIQEYGYGVRRKKIGIMPANIAQKVTGLSTNRKLNITQRTTERIRSKILTIAKNKNGITKKERESIEGDINFVSTVSKEKAEKLIDFAAMILPKSNIMGNEVNKPITRPCRHHKVN